MSVKILLVDDEQRVLDFIKDMVRPLPWCEVVAVMDSREAAKCLESHKFDGVIVDAGMPHLDGFEVTQRVRTSPLNAGAPIVMLADDGDIETMRRGFKAGVSFFMAKPSNRERVYRLFNAVRGTMLREKRRYARLPYRTRVKCAWGEHGEKHFASESLEIGEGGMSLAPSGGLEAGQDVELEFVLPQITRSGIAPARKAKRSIFAEPEISLSEPQKTRAKVRYRTPPDCIGLEFVGLLPAHRQVIQRYITGAVEA